MSLKELLTVHLDDYVLLTDKLLESMANFSSEGGPTHTPMLVDSRGTASIQTKLPGSSSEQTKKIMQKILRKDQLLQETVSKYVSYEKFQKKILQLRAEIAATDNAIIDFATKLGQLEQKLHDATTDRKTLKDLDGIITKQDFNVDEVMTFAERLGLMSFAPSDYLEQKGMSPQKPPAPQEDTISTSINHFHLSELLKLVEQEELERKKKQESDKDAMDVDKEPEKKEGQVESFKPPPGWKPGDPIRPEHLQYLYKMSTLSRKTSTPPEPTPQPTPPPPPPLKLEPPMSDTKLTGNTPVIGNNPIIKTETKHSTIPTTHTTSITSTSIKIKQELSIPSITTTADDLLTELMGDIPSITPSRPPPSLHKPPLPSTTGPGVPPPQVPHMPRPVSSRLNPELDDLGLSSDEDDADDDEEI